MHEILQASFTNPRTAVAGSFLTRSYPKLRLYVSAVSNRIFLYLQQMLLLYKDRGTDTYIYKLCKNR